MSAFFVFLLLCSDMPALWPQTPIPAALSETQNAQLRPAQTDEGFDARGI